MLGLFGKPDIGNIKVAISRHEDGTIELIIGSIRLKALVPGRTVSGHGTNNKKEHSWIHTFTGKKFFPFNPKTEDIDIVDIAHALSNKCRFNGHTNRFYSVAQHSVIVSLITDSLEGLLHDAGEAYLPDVPSPIKGFLPLLVEAENNIMKCVTKKFTLCWCTDTDYNVKMADKVALLTEIRDLMGNFPFSIEGINRLPNRIIDEDPCKSKNNFLKRFMQLTGRKR